MKTDENASIEEMNNIMKNGWLVRDQEDSETTQTKPLK